MKLRNLFIQILTFLSLSLFGQMTEVGVYGGMTHFIGDVGNYSFHLPQGWSAGAIGRFQFDRHWGIRGQLTYGIVGNDDQLSNISWRNERNLNFQSEIIEGALMLEFNFFEYVTGSKEMWQTPYIFGGIGAFSFNPQTLYEGEWIDLQPLGTEGQGTSASGNGNYPTTGLNVNFGLGYRLSLGKNTSMTFEVGARRTSTDYLDDVSGVYANPTVLVEENGELSAILADRSGNNVDKTGKPRGNAQNDDWYIYSGISFFYTITAQRERCKRFR